jgi:hypothetical protein
MTDDARAQAEQRLAKKLQQKLTHMKLSGEHLGWQVTKHIAAKLAAEEIAKVHREGWFDGHGAHHCVLNHYYEDESEVPWDKVCADAEGEK